MTSIARTPDLDVLLTLCCECGTTRTVSRRASGFRGSRTLRCETCRRTTEHAAIGADHADWREESNRKKTPTLSAADKLDVLESMGVRIEYRDTREDVNGNRAIVSLWWWFDDDFLLLVNRDSTDAERDKRLTTALKYVTEPRKNTWFIETQDDGPVANVCFAVETGR